MITIIAYSERLIQKIASSGYFQLTDVSTTNRDVMSSIESGTADIIIEIEGDFEKSLVNDGICHILISANSINGTKSGLGSSYLSSIINDYTSELREERRIQNMGISEIPILRSYNTNSIPISTTKHLWFRP